MAEYRVRETLIYVQTHNDIRCERGYIAERRIRFLGLVSIWWPVLNGDWRPTVKSAEYDALHDAELRRPGRVVRLFEVSEGS